MHSSEIRRAFLGYFEEHGHTVVPSGPLVPDDPTLLFTNAGMVPFKDAFLGLEARSYRRAVSVQKCLRVSGKHNDLDNVGPSPRHHTFFEMLGNFSFGDYFKRDAIRLGWRFVTERMRIDPDRLVLTVHRDDEDAFELWTRDIGVGAERVLPMGDKTNFWMMADTGPCGPTSEIHYDFGPGACSCGRADCSVALDNDCGRWLELWNLVFMQYDQTGDGSRLDLPQTGVDTGMGLERMVAIQQGASSNYDTDLFQPIMDRVQALAGHSEVERALHRTGYRVLADHGRAMAFLIGDGVLPGNDGRNYVLRLIMRRAMRFGRLIGFEEPFLAQVSAAVVEKMGEAYPELVRKADWIHEVVATEEARFARTLDAGTDILDDLIRDLHAGGKSVIAGADAFRLYDTFGFPPDLTRVVAEEQGLTIDMAGFEAAMAEQRARARAGGQFALGAGEDSYRRLGLPDVTFLGYDTLQAEGTVIALMAEGHPIVRGTEGMELELVLDRTPFYAESGGQVGDTGTLEGPEGRLRVLDTRRPVPGVIAHICRVEAGTVTTGDSLEARVDAERRLEIMRNHTATHLLHRALQDVLGEHAQQRGSLVAPDRLRFDFAHLSAVTPEELERIESEVNRLVREDRPVHWSLLPLDEARRQGATMLFGEKYGDVVRMIEVEGVSRELCGGTHLARTGQAGAFVVTSESAVAAGIRRIEARTGLAAERFVRERLRLLEATAAALKLQSVDELATRIEELQGRNRELGRELAAAQEALAATRAGALAAQAQDVDGLRLAALRVEAADPDQLRTLALALRDQLGSGVVVLGAEIGGLPRLVAVVSDDLVEQGRHAGQLIRALAPEIGGGGGGRPNLAEAGGRDATGLDRALGAVSEHLRAAKA